MYSSCAKDWALARRLYAQDEDKSYFCLNGKSRWVMQWPGKGWGFIQGSGSPVLTVPYRNQRAGVGEAGFASTGKASAGKGRRTLYSRIYC